MPSFKPVRLEAEIHLVESTEEKLKELASIVKFPENKTPDVLFFSGCFVSSGENLNHAYFLPSEMIKAHASINNKPLDIEHEESNIIGHIYSSAFVDQNGNILNVEELAKLETKALDQIPMDVLIGGIVYKSRFPKLADEVKQGSWKLSMETYYENYDIKIGSLILSRKEAEALGLASNNVLGRMAKILKKGVELAAGQIARVLRGLMFSGCGLVKQPANPRSLIFEAANKMDNKETLIVELEPENTKKEEQVASKVEKPEETADISVEDVRTQTSVGICVSYKRFIYNTAEPGPDSKLVHKDWCTLFESSCTSFSRDVTDPKCLRRQANKQAAAYVEARLNDIDSKSQRGRLLKMLKDLLD